MSKDTQNIWASHAPDYKKQGELYCKVEYNNKGEPESIKVARNQIVKGMFMMDGSTAVYESLDNVNLTEEVISYIKQLPFVDHINVKDIKEDKLVDEEICNI